MENLVSYIICFIGFVVLLKIFSAIMSFHKYEDEKRLNRAKAMEIEQRNARNSLHRKSVENQIRMEELYIEIAEARLENLRGGDSKAGKEEDALLRELERKIGQKPRD